MERPPCSSKHLSLTANKSYLRFVLHHTVSLNSKEIPRTLANPWWPRRKGYGEKPQIRHGCYQFITEVTEVSVKHILFCWWYMATYSLYVYVTYSISTIIFYDFSLCQWTRGVFGQRKAPCWKKERGTKWQIILLPIVTMSVNHPPLQPYL